ncbi:zinc ribbon domain-containing protein [Anaerosporobacter sp.]|uniref:zinc ribbon domain-containing protein n=1 Tax=Anaerosporobacter sp. TaxID=1872529 RepID=UPI00286EEA57|nr:zinc ribbon domain-containing protein [Anaerosporobacter sp.]
MQVQEELVRRANLKTGKADGSKRVYSSKYALSSIVFCGGCGDIYRRIHWNNRGKKSVVWRCVGRLEDKNSDCDSPTILEEDLQRGVLKAINRVITDSNGFIEVLECNIATVLGVDFDKDTSEIESQLVELQEQIVRAANRKEHYDTLVNEIFRLREAKQSMQEYNADRKGKRQRVADMTAFLKEQTGEMTEYDDKLVRQLVERMDICESHLSVIFKSGIKIEINL